MEESTVDSLVTGFLAEISQAALLYGNFVERMNMVHGSALGL